MKKLGIPIAILAVLGIASLFLPNGDGPSMFAVFLERDRFRLILMLVAFGLPLVAAILALQADVVRNWRAVMALGGFAIATVKAQVWSMIGNFGDIFLPMKIQTAVIIGGVILSLFAVAKDE